MYTSQNKSTFALTQHTFQWQHLQQNVNVKAETNKQKDVKGSNNKEICNGWKEILDKFEITTLPKLTTALYLTSTLGCNLSRFHL